jgi:hypothetical protein
LYFNPLPGQSIAPKAELSRSDSPVAKALAPFANPDRVSDDYISRLINDKDKFFGLQNDLLIEAANEVLSVWPRTALISSLPQELGAISFGETHQEVRADENRNRLAHLVYLLNEYQSVDRFMLRRNSHIITVRKDVHGWVSIDSQPNLKRRKSSLKDVDSLEQIFFSEKKEGTPPKVQTIIIDKKFAEAFAEFELDTSPSAQREKIKAELFSQM